MITVVTVVMVERGTSLPEALTVLGSAGLLAACVLQLARSGGLRGGVARAARWALLSPTHE